MRVQPLMHLVAVGLGAAGAGAQPAPVALAPVAHIGCATCAGPEAFGSVAAVAVGGGWVVVGDRDPPHLRVFRVDGSFVAAFAADGDGPDEMRLPAGLSVTAGRVVALDGRRLRIVVLDFQGTVTDEARLEGYPVASAFAPGDARAYGILTDFRTGTASVVEWEPGRGARAVADPLAGLDLGRGPPPSPSLARARDGGFAVGHGDTVYRLAFYDADGRLEREVVREVPRTPKTAEEILAERELRRPAGPPGGPPGRGRGEEAVVPGRRPDVDPLRPHFRGGALSFDPDGRLWVRTERGRDATVFDIFDRRGAFLGETTVAGRLDRFALGDGYLVAGVRGELDIPTVGVWRVGVPRP